MLDILRDNWLYLLIGQYPDGPLGGLALTLVLAAVSLAITAGAAAYEWRATRHRVA